VSEGDALAEFVAVMRRLRAECAWKQEQTHRSLARYLLEETHETLEAIDTGDPAHLQEELGDLLLQIYFHAAIAEEAGEFTMDDVVAGLADKMVRRNPHVFGPAAGDAPPQSIDQIEEAWQAAKAAEKSYRTSPLEGIPTALPALLYADKVLARLGDPVLHGDRPAGRPSDRPVDRPGDGVGDRLLALVAEARASGADPEQELRDAVRRLLDS
jgi:XTP/dITP diphosphohydrolase